MQKGQKVILLVVLYALASWLTRSQRWAPPPLVAPASIAQGLTPRQPDAPRPGGGTDLALAAPLPPAPASEALAVPEVVTATARGEAPPPLPQDSWQGFVAKLRALERGQRAKVRAIHFGDSELVGDGTSGSIRRELAARFGLGGLGFSLAMLPLPWYLREHWRHREGRGFKVFSYPHGKLDGGMYGPGGVAFDSPPGSRAVVKMRHPMQGACTVRFFFSHLPQGGDVKLYADGMLLQVVTTERARAGLGVVAHERTSCPSELELVTATRATRVYGWEVEYQSPGVVWSNLGIVSAQLPQLAHFAHLPCLGIVLSPLRQVVLAEVILVIQHQFIETGPRHVHQT